MSKGFPPNLQGLMKQAQKMQKDLQKVQEESENLSAEGSAGGGMVKVVVNGKLRLTSVSIDAEVVKSNDHEMLQDMFLAATNSALEDVQEKVKTAMGKVTGGMNVPGLF